MFRFYTIIYKFVKEAHSLSVTQVLDADEEIEEIHELSDAGLVDTFFVFLNPYVKTSAEDIYH
jgi:hypothetical protein